MVVSHLTAGISAISDPSFSQVTFSCPIESTICSWFRNPYPFAGCYVWNRTDKDHKVKPKEEWVIVPHACPAIISYQQADGIYQKAQQNKNIAPNKGLKQPSKYLLTGLIVCPVCQSHFVVNSDHRRKQYHYICGTRNRISQGCSNKALDTDETVRGSANEPD